MMAPFKSRMAKSFESKEMALNRDQSPIDRLYYCRSKLEDAEASFTTQSYETLVEAYESAHEIDRSEKYREEFCREQFWKRCASKRPSPDDNLDAIMLWVTRFVYRAASTTSSAYTRAFKHARVLRGYASKVLSAVEVRERLENEGTELAYNLEVERASKHDRTLVGSLPKATESVETHESLQENDIEALATNATPRKKPAKERLTRPGTTAQGSSVARGPTRPVESPAPSTNGLREGPKRPDDQVTLLARLQVDEGAQTLYGVPRGSWVTAIIQVKEMEGNDPLLRLHRVTRRPGPGRDLV